MELMEDVELIEGRPAGEWPLEMPGAYHLNNNLSLEDDGSLSGFEEVTSALHVDCCNWPANERSHSEHQRLDLSELVIRVKAFVTFDMPEP